jgi:hypothetical protein
VPDAPTPEAFEVTELAQVGRPEFERIDETHAGTLDTGNDPRDWDRASIRLKTHPLHPFSGISPADFLIVPAQSRLKLVGDCVFVVVAMAGLCFFPLWIADVLMAGAMGNWFWVAIASVGAISGIALFFLAPVADRKYMEKL